jgi:hypothetical protein
VPHTGERCNVVFDTQKKKKVIRRTFVVIETLELYTLLFPLTHMGDAQLDSFANPCTGTARGRMALAKMAVVVVVACAQVVKTVQSTSTIALRGQGPLVGRGDTLIISYRRTHTGESYSFYPSMHTC